MQPCVFHLQFEKLNTVLGPINSKSAVLRGYLWPYEVDVFTDTKAIRTSLRRLVLLYAMTILYLKARVVQSYGYSKKATDLI